MGEQNLQNQQAGADHDRAVGQIEHRPLILLDVEQKKIDYAAAGDSVPEIARGPAEYQSEGDGGGRERLPLFPKQDGNNHHRDGRKADQHCGFPVCGRIGEQAEGSAGILGVGEAEESGDDLNVSVQRDVGSDEPLGPAIGNDDEQSESQVSGAGAIEGHSVVIVSGPAGVFGSG